MLFRSLTTNTRFGTLKFAMLVLSVDRITFASSIANFKVPKRVFVVSDLPRNAMGKVQKNLLRQEHAKLFV